VSLKTDNVESRTSDVTVVMSSVLRKSVTIGTGAID
jgi:hypothetical protein